MKGKNRKSKVIVQSIEDIIAKKRYSALNRENFIRSLIKFLIFLLFIYIVFTKIIGLGKVVGVDMYPALKDGDLVVYNRIYDEYRIDDIITFVEDGERKYLRIVALPGDSIEIDQEGNFKVNGNIQEEEIFYPTLIMEDEKFYTLVKTGEVFTLGDFRTGAEDGRKFGATSIGKIDGKIISLFRSRGL